MLEIGPIRAWSRPAALAMAFALAVLLASPAHAGGDASSDPMVAQARAIHERVLTLDSHIDIPFVFGTELADPGVDGGWQVDLPKMAAGGLNGGFFVVYVGQRERTIEGYGRATTDALIKFEAIHGMTERYGEQIGLADTAAEARRLHEAGRLVALIGIENGFVIGEDIALLARYRELGARYMTLTHNGHNAIGDSAQPDSELGDADAEHGGLSAFGRQVVGEMNRLGILIDVSHIAPATLTDAIAVSAAPVFASHSNARALIDHPRNLDDEQLKAIAASGGVIQTVAYPTYLITYPPEQSEADWAFHEEWSLMGHDDWRMLERDEPRRIVYEAAYGALMAQWPEPSVADLADHIDHMVGVVGIDHVGISSDFGGGGGIVGWRHAGESFNVTLELARRGYSETEIAKLWGGNLLRALDAADRVSADIQATVN
jgi:membrane dipeptidase